MEKQQNSELTAKQLRFCHEYVLDLNGKQAAIRSGYAARSAEVTASKLLSNTKLKSYIEALENKVLDTLEITHEKVMREYARIAFSDIREYFDKGGGLKSIHDLSDDAAGAISAIETEELFEDSGKDKSQVGFVRKIKMWDKRGALDSICRIKGWNAPEEVKHTGKIRIGYGKEEG